jgi:hypothetical protein
MITNDNEILPKNAEKFNCVLCNFKCSKQSNWDSHIITRKHKKIINDNENRAKTFVCDCGKTYKYGSGLSRHKTVCTVKEKENTVTTTTSIWDAFPDDNSDKRLIFKMLDESADVKKALLEQNKHVIEQNKQFTDLNKKVTEQNKHLIEQNQHLAVQNQHLATVVETNTNALTTISNKTTNNITNNQFNLNIFLNDTCKDAMNITEFLQDLEIQMKELENVANNGYVTGITDIILSRLKKLDIAKRPLHCTDAKREVLYIKDENAWNKDDQDKAKLKKMITTVANKNYRKIPEWRERNPDCKDPENQQYDFCIKMMRNSLGELGDEQTRLEEKIIKNIAKQVAIDKNATPV